MDCCSLSLSLEETSFREIYKIFRKHAQPDGSPLDFARLDRTAVLHPLAEQVQVDGRIRRWAMIDEAGGRYLRVVLLPDGETVHNAFFDRSFKP
jgi:hypothetical protein